MIPPWGSRWHLQLKEDTLIPEWMFEDKTERQLTRYEMSNEKNALHSLLEDMEKFVELNSMKINEKDKNSFL